MSLLRAIVVDDEAGCIQNLTYHISKYCPDIEVIATAEDAKTATTLLRDKTVNVAFLDVELFDENIFNVLHLADDHLCDIVFVTAHERYAVEAFRVSALDYLVKPLNKTELIHCYKKIQKRYTTPITIQVPETLENNPGIAKIILRQGKEVYVIAPSDIVFLEASGFYTTVHFLMNGSYNSVLLSKSIKEVHKGYNYDYLMRVHRSFVVNTGKVASIKKMSTGLSLQMDNAFIIPVARRRITSFLEFCKQNR